MARVKLTHLKMHATNVILRRPNVFFEKAFHHKNEFCCYFLKNVLWLFIGKLLPSWLSNNLFGNHWGFSRYYSILEEAYGIGASFKFLPVEMDIKTSRSVTPITLNIFVTAVAL